MNKKTAWKTLSSRYVYQSGWMKIRSDEFEMPNGTKGTYEVVERRDYVLVIPLIDTDFYLVNQFRYPVGQESLEFPEGGINPGETPEKAAFRELTEETGLIAGSLDRLGFLYTANGHNTQGCHIYLAKDCRMGSRKLDHTEYGMETKKLTLQELKEALRNGSINDSPTAAALALYLSSL